MYWWRYCIRLENLGEATVQLRERNWRIFSLSGTLETVRGRGVVAAAELAAVLGWPGGERGEELRDTRLLLRPHQPGARG